MERNFVIKAVAIVTLLGHVAVEGTVPTLKFQRKQPYTITKEKISKLRFGFPLGLQDTYATFPHMDLHKYNLRPLIPWSGHEIKPLMIFPSLQNSKKQVLKGKTDPDSNLSPYSYWLPKQRFSEKAHFGKSYDRSILSSEDNDRFDGKSFRFSKRISNSFPTSKLKYGDLKYGTRRGSMPRTARTYEDKEFPGNIKDYGYMYHTFPGSDVSPSSSTGNQLHSNYGMDSGEYFPFQENLYKKDMKSVEKKIDWNFGYKPYSKQSKSYYKMYDGFKDKFNSLSSKNTINSYYSSKNYLSQEFLPKPNQQQDFIRNDPILLSSRKAMPNTTNTREEGESDRNVPFPTPSTQDQAQTETLQESVTIETAEIAELAPIKVPSVLVDEAFPCSAPRSIVCGATRPWSLVKGMNDWCERNCSWEVHKGSCDLSRCRCRCLQGAGEAQN